MKLPKKLKLYVGLPLLIGFIALIILSWIRAGQQQDLWNHVHASLTEQLRSEQKRIVLDNALNDYVLYSEFRADINPEGVENYKKAKVLLERLKAGERDTLVGPTVQGLHLVKTWFPDPQQTADQAVAKFHKDYAKAGEAIVSIVVMRRIFDEEWAKR